MGKLITTKEYAELTDQTQRNVSRLCKEGKIPCMLVETKKGSMYMIDEDLLEEKKLPIVGNFQITEEIVKEILSLNEVISRNFAELQEKIERQNEEIQQLRELLNKKRWWQVWK